MNELIKKLAKYTLIKSARAQWLLNRWAEVERARVQGAIVECGCWRGGTIALLGNVSNRQLWAFDLFDRLDKQATPEELVHPVRNKAAKPEYVMDALVIAGVDRRRLTLTAGDLCEKASQVAGIMGPIALLCLDVDWYKPTLAALNALYGNVAKGGGIYVDDYYCWPGCKRAVREFWRTYPEAVGKGYRIHRPAIFWRKP